MVVVTVLDIVATDMILDYSLIQVSKVDTSVAMEKDGLQCLISS